MARALLLVLSAVSVLGAAERDIIQVKLTAPAMPYCRIVVFPSGWKAPLPVPGRLMNVYWYNSSYEFRQHPNRGEEYLIAGATPTTKVRDYTDNKYKLNLADASVPVLPTSDAEWESAKTIELHDKPELFQWFGEPDPVLKLRGREYRPIGKNLALSAGRESPDGKILVVHSWTGKVDTRASSAELFVRGWRYRGKVFYDFYDARAGSRIFAIEGAYYGMDPSSALAETRWLTHRYFLIPLGARRERCVVCDFGKSVPKE